MSGLFATGTAADLVLLAMAIEAVLLTAAGRSPRVVAAAILPGALLALALRGALVGVDWHWIALPLALSLPLHLADLHARGWGGRLQVARNRRSIPSGEPRSRG